MSKLWLGSFCPTLLVSVLREASLSLDLVLMPGMENMTSALRTSGVRLCVNISHSSGLGARISDCFLCCSFKTWLKLVLFSLFFVKSWRCLCSGWSGILFNFYPCVRSSAFPRESRGSTPAVFCMVAMGVLFISPSMVLRPMFCTWSSLFVWVLAAVAHALAPYSSIGRTVPVYPVVSMRGDAPQCVPESRFSRASFWMPLFLIDLIWFP